jgi:mono/diheme cytochrome c family protein
VSLALLAALCAVGCQSFSSASESPPAADPGFVSDPPGSTGPGFPTNPVDERPVTVASRPPPAISGGTLLALSDGRRALVADPDRDKISIVDFVGEFFSGVLTLEAGAQPGRSVEDKSGHAYVVLRGTGEVLTVDLASATAGERRKVCAMPRGIALEPSGERLVVACAEGKLVNLALSGTDSLRETKTSADVRDVVFSGTHGYVSRFRSAELATLDTQLNVASLQKLPSVADTFREDSQLGTVSGLFDAAVAWRAAPGPEGSVVIVHQRATSDDIKIEHPSGDGTADSGNAGGFGSPSAGESTYGGAFSGCGGIVHSAVTVVSANGTVVTSPQLGGVVLPVDVAVSKDGLVAVASAGARDQGVPTSFAALPASSVTVLTVAQINRSNSGSCISAGSASTVPFQDPVVAVAFDPVQGRLLAQTREPARLMVFDNIQSNPRQLMLPGESVLDTGHEIFHRDAGGGIACASCHVEGTDDGRTWNFAPFGARRTQAIDVGLAGTEPFHWDGTLPTLDKLMSEVFVGRMGGTREAPARIAAIQDWIFQLSPRAPLRPASDVAAQRGKALFELREVGCKNCHSGEKFTSAGSVDVGTGGEFQVPSLLGIGQRLPAMHNGCAATLMDRFDASCGGTQHGNTSQLSRPELEDLVAYLESL